MARIIRTSPQISSISLHYMDRESLLDMRICDLPISLERHWIKKNISKLYSELAHKGLRFRPHIWISDDWFSPDGVSGFAIPFFITHPRLIELEAQMMGEAEGATPKWCMQLFRHETGHAIDNAFHLRKNKRRQALFGLTSTEYPESYLPNKKSKEYVRHLEGHYAQAHPDEDWAETFATWLTPKLNWQQQYKNWPALEKLELLDEMLSSLRGKLPVTKKKLELDSFRNNQMTLREYYRKKRIHYGRNIAPKFKTNLKKIFPIQGQAPAWKFIRNNQNQIAKGLAIQTQLKLGKVKKMVTEIEKTCRKEKLRYPQSLSNRQIDQQKKEQLILLIMENTDRFSPKKSSHILM